MILSRHFLALPLALAVLVSTAVAGATDSARRLDQNYDDVARQLREARERVRVLEERLRQLDARHAREAGSDAVAKPQAKECGLPFVLDDQGIKHLRAECAPGPREASTASARDTSSATACRS
jgi:type II secretory pathway component PulJ